MSAIRKAPALASDDWMLQQQLRAEIEADTWRRLREALAQPAEAAPNTAGAPPAATKLSGRIHSSGSAILKALVRFSLASFAAYVAWIAARDAALGGFEVWLATGAGFLVSLSLTMFDPIRQLVRVLAMALGWAIVIALGFTGVWLLVQMSP